MRLGANGEGVHHADGDAFMPPDILWLAVLGGLCLLTLGFVRLCDLS